jgi:methyltransferase (TIGR00027 family)
MAENESPIEHVSDTAIWVATFRARESESKNPLFHDPLARVLIGEKGENIVARMGNAKILSWTMVVRTHLIDRLIETAIQDGVDTVLNLGAGLDTRPYRMALPPELNWIEVDYPSIIRLKEDKLGTHLPRCRLERISMDLSQRKLRQELFKSINEKSKRVLILTEGVVPYIKNEDVATLAQDLRAQSHFADWILDYISPRLMQYLSKGKFSKSMQKAPFQFNPTDWKAFFSEKGWQISELHYLAHEGYAINRHPPMPWMAKVFSFFINPRKMKFFNEMSGFALLKTK